MLDLIHLAADTYTSSNLTVDSPLVLGPVAAFIFTVFVSEIVVSGKTYRREVEENVRLRTVTERVIPLAENMVDVTREVSEGLIQSTRVMEDVLDWLADDAAARGSRRSRRSD
jgi:hypothetical protein